MITCIAIDIGASSGRLIAGMFDGNTIEMKEIHRFSNDPVHIGEHYYWDILRIFWEIKQGLKKSNELKIDSIAVDTWGVDYALFDKDGHMIAMPRHYRDSCNQKEQPDFPFTKEEIYNLTGIQHLDFNTIYQLYSDAKYLRKSVINNAAYMLMVPDIINFFLTNEKKSEYTNASTSQMLNPYTKQWDSEIIKKLSFNKDLFLNPIMPGALYGYVIDDIINKYGLNSNISVVAVGSHDTASAVAGIPFADKGAAFLSLGTWALIGKEIPKPIITKQSQQVGFSNEGGVFDTIRFLKNISGTFLLQRLRKAYNYEIGFADIIEAAKNNSKKSFCIDPNHKAFIDPDNIKDDIYNYCVEHNQGKPETLGDYSIAIYNGLVNCLSDALKNLESVMGEPVSYLHIVGGGTKDDFLCQHIANTINKKVLSGPVESTIMGNIIIQLYALGKIKSLEEGRAVIRKSVDIKEYLPI